MTNLALSVYSSSMRVLCVPLLLAVSVVIDTDAGSDDLMAIAFLVSRPDVRVEAINVVHGLAHVPQGAQNVRKLLAAAGRAEIPVHLGRGQPLQKTAEFPAAWRKTADELLAALPAVEVASPREDAVSYYRSHSLSGKTILALGPLTNLAAAIENGARIHAIVMMGGAFRVPGNLGEGGYFKTTNRTAEWNVFSDPKAADIVFRSGAAIRVVPLDATNEVPLDRRFLEDYRRGVRSPLGKAVAHLLERDGQVIDEGIFYAWDPLAAVALVDPKIAQWQRLRVRIRDDGTTEEAPRGGTVAQVALHADGARFRSVFLGAVH